MIHNPAGIRWRILLPLITAVLVLLAASLASIYRLHQQQLDDNVAAFVEQTHVSFEMLLTKEAQMAEAQLDFLQQDGKLQEIWKSRDREGLEHYATPLFRHLRAKHQITHFYLMEPDRVCFLRVHNPARHGDIIERFTAVQAADRGKTSWGLELGQFGTFALRVVRPWLIDGQLVGYLELGLEIDHLTPLMSRAVKTDFFFAIDKSFIERKAWEEGLAVMGHKGNWELFPDFVIADRSMDDIPPQLADLWALNRAKPGNTLFTVAEGPRIYRGGFIPLLDAGARKVGDIVALYDLTHEQSRLHSAMMRLIVVAVLICGLLIVLFYLLIGRIIPRLAATYDKLTTEIVNREQTEWKLKKLSTRNDALLAAVPDIIVEVDTDKIMTWMNEAAVLFYGEDAIGKPADYYFVGDQDTYAQVEPLFRGCDDIIFVESRQRRRDGAVRLLGWWCRVLKDADGTVTGTLSTARDITESRRIGQELRNSERRLQDLLQCSSDWVWEVNEHGTFTYASDKVYPILGYTPEEIVGMTPFDLMPPDEADRVGQHFIQDVADKSSFKDLENWNIAKDGSRICTSTSAMPILDADGNLKGFRGVNKVITEQKLTAQALAESEAKFRTIFDTTSDAIMLLDKDGFFDCNDATLKMFGCSSREEFLGNRPDELSPEYQPNGRSSRELVEEYNAAAMQNGNHRFEWIHHRLDGTEFPVEVLLNTLEINGKRALQAVVRDISERKQAEKALAESEEKFRSFVENANDIIYALSTEGIFTYVSPNWTEILGHDPSEVLGKGIDFIVHPDDLPECWNFLTKILTTGEKQSGVEYRVRHKNGEWKWHTSNASPIKDREGLAIEYLGISRDIAERKQAEEQLINSRKEYQELFNSVLEGIGLVDANEMIQLCNPSFARIFEEPSPKAMLGKNLRSYVPEDQHHILLAETEKRKGGNISRYEIDIITAKNNRRTISVSISGRFDQENRYLGAYGSIIDITERKQAEEEISKFKTIADNASHGAVIVNLRGDILYINNHFAAMHGYVIDELLGINLSIFHTPEQLTDVIKINEDVVSTGSYSSREVWHKHRDGTVFPTLMSGVIIKDKDGQPLYLAAMASDITEIKHKEEALRQSDEYSRSIVETANDAFAAIDNNGILIDWNHQAEKIFGWTRAEILGQRIDTTIIPPDFRQKHCEGLNRFLKTAEGPILNQRVEINAMHRDGHEFPVELTVWPVRFGHATYFNAFLHDITERKQTEEQLHRSREEAEAASMAKSEFLANMSHEIRTPMNGIMGMVHLLRRDGPSAKQAQRLDTIDRSAKHLLEIINNILDLSKIEAGKLVIEEVPIRIDAIIDNVRTMLAERARNAGLELRVTSIDQTSPLLGDPTRIEQCLLNYAANAIKFTAQGSVTLSVAKLDETEGSVTLRFGVADTGIGIDPEAAKRLFAAFEQADNSTTRKYGGTGLGLAITKHLAQLMGGTVGVESHPGAGSCFWFTATLRKEEAPPDEDQTAAIDAELILRERFAGSRILVVDDEPVNREIARMSLESAALAVDTARDGAEATAMALSNDYDAILMDVQMPCVDGFEATEAIRAIPGYADTPIIAMTANAFAEDKARCLAAGMNGFLAKPFDPGDLFAKLLHYLETRDRVR
ncbi:MAG: PAS domain S-box protein [Pseudomonadota bacterium]